MTAEFASDDVKELCVYDVGRKPRPVISVGGDLRCFQERFYRNCLRHRMKPSAFSFGCVPGRHIVANASRHLGNRYVYKTDISNFYPSISIDRVNRLFLKQLRCSPEVSSILTRLCTYDFHLALGLVTSPVLADQILLKLDGRIAGLCRVYDARYSRFVDDIAISANFDIERTPIPQKVEEILESHGLRTHPNKTGGGHGNRMFRRLGMRCRCRRGWLRPSRL
ncbi:MAG: RNA-directed DNA polymerase, partial [Planctomycetaceae bacterium]|nr:RNA-directed DNA polymerase [Planctomycetaceae bacterium]